MSNNLYANLIYIRSSVTVLSKFSFINAKFLLLSQPSILVAAAQLITTSGFKSFFYS